MSVTPLFGRTQAGFIASVITVAAAIVPLYSALGDQSIVKDYVAAGGWTALVPLNVNGDALTDYLSYNATTGHAIVSVGVGESGEQTIVKDYMAAPGRSALVPLDVDGQGGDDLLSYNTRTGRAIVSVAVGRAGEQAIVKDYMAAPGWTAIVPMDVDHDAAGLTDYLSYNAATGQAIVSVGSRTAGDQTIVKRYMAAAGWTIVVPMNVDCDPDGLTDYLSYNGRTGRAIVSVAAGGVGEQRVVKDYVAAPGWTAIVPMHVNVSDMATDLLSYNAQSGRGIVSVGEACGTARR